MSSGKTLMPLKASKSKRYEATIPPVMRMRMYGPKNVTKPTMRAARKPEPPPAATATYPVPKFLQFVYDTMHTVLVRVELDLAWKVKQHVLVLERREFLLQPVKVHVDVVHTVHKA